MKRYLRLLRQSTELWVITLLLSAVTLVGIYTRFLRPGDTLDQNWQNGFMERFFGSFKAELGKLARYQDIAELYEGIALTVHYYNTERIHSALSMSPAAYAASLMPASLERDKVSGKVGP